MKKYGRSLFIFRRDLRLDDNTALLMAQKESSLVIPCFIFDPRQVGNSNEYRGQNSLHFMMESLADLSKKIDQCNGTLYFFYGIQEEVVKVLITKLSCNAVFINNDYTPYSQHRDAKIESYCTSLGIDFHSYDDALLNAPHHALKADGKPYTVFTPFFKNAASIPVREPVASSNFSFLKLPQTILKALAEYTAAQKNILSLAPNKLLFEHGGRDRALILMDSLEQLKGYKDSRDFPFIKTSGLAPHLKFGTISAREAYYGIAKKLGYGHDLLRQLYWRDFFTHIAYHFPYVFEGAFHKKYDRLPWSYDTELFERWCTGTTGFPIVDAGMRELVATGFMHNRVRMITASFLVKDLHIDWRWGEKFFAQHLADYDPAVNNGNWQWAASTGCDAQPYFRIFNPWLQQKKFDPECRYIKKWIPELKHQTTQEIHNWYKISTKQSKYPAPIVQHDKEAALTKKVYKDIAAGNSL